MSSSPRRRPTSSRSGTRSRAACERDELIEGHHQRAREGRPLGHHPRRREGVPARLAGRPAPGAQPRRVHRQELRVQGHQVQQEARQHRALAPRAPREGARRAEGEDAREPQGRPDRRGHRQEPHRVRCVHRPRRHRRPAPHHRHVAGAASTTRPSCSRSATTSASRSSSSTPRPSASRSASSRSRKTRGTTPPRSTRPARVVRGKVVSLTDYGAFIELEQGIEGLVHVSEMSWTSRVKHPSKVVAVGDMVEAVVLDVDADARSASALGMKQLEPNPCDAARRRSTRRARSSRARSATSPTSASSSAIEEGIDGLVHSQRPVAGPSGSSTRRELYQKGDEVEAVVLNIDRRREAKVSLGIKQLVRRSVGSHPVRLPGRARSSRARSSRSLDFGAFVEIEKGVEGLVHVSEISEERVEDPQDVRQAGPDAEGGDHRRRHGRAQDRPVVPRRDARRGAGRRAGLLGRRAHGDAGRRHARQAGRADREDRRGQRREAGQGRGRRRGRRAPAAETTTTTARATTNRSRPIHVGQPVGRGRMRVR